MSKPTTVTPTPLLQCGNGAEHQPVIKECILDSYGENAHLTLGCLNCSATAPYTISAIAVSFAVSFANTQWSN